MRHRVAGAGGGRAVGGTRGSGALEAERDPELDELGHPPDPQLLHHPRAVQLVAAADKLHNLTSMVIDHNALGDALWTRFNRGRPNIAWYYRSTTASLSAGDLRDHPVVAQLAETVEQFFGPDAQTKG